jgi:MOSC domain-containing protein YiiM
VDADPAAAPGEIDANGPPDRPVARPAVTDAPTDAGRRSGLNPGSWVSGLLDAPMRPGIVTWIGLRPHQRKPLLAVTRAELDETEGLIGDHYQSHTRQTRQLTVIQAEHIAAIAGYLGRDCIDPDRLRRNVVVSGINLQALKGRRFRIGSAICMATGECHPCSRMEEILGVGGYNAVRGHGGITARVVAGGEVSLGDAIVRWDE